MTKTDYAVAPGEYLAEWIEDHPDVDRDAVAKQLQTSRLVIDRLIEGRIELDPALAARLEGLTSVPTAAWLRYEQQYRDDLRRLRAEDPRTEKFAPADLPDWDGTWRTLGQDEATMRKRLATWTKADLVNANVIARQREIQLSEERPMLPALPSVDELATTVAAGLDSDMRLLVLAAGVTQKQFEEQFPGILAAISRRAAAAALATLRDRATTSGSA